MVLCGDAVRGEQVDGLGRAEPSVLHTRQDLVDGILRQRDQSIWCHLGVVGTSRKELEARAASTVANAYSAGELDAASGEVFSNTRSGGQKRQINMDIQVTEGDVMLECEGLLLADDLVQAGAGVEAGLDVGEGHDGAVGTAATVQGAVVSAKV